MGIVGAKHFDHAEWRWTESGLLVNTVSFEGEVVGRGICNLHTGLQISRGLAMTLREILEAEAAKEGGQILPLKRKA